MLSPSGSLCAATSCPEVSVPVRFPIPLPGSDGCCSEPLQRSRFTSHKSVWRRKGRERRLSLLLPQTLSHHPGQAATGPPPACPVWLERCPKWIKEPPRENEPLAIPQPARRQQVVHRTGLPDEPQGAQTGSWGPRKMGYSGHLGTRAKLSPLCSSSDSAAPKAPAAPFQGAIPHAQHIVCSPTHAGTPLLPGPQTWP